MIKHPIFIKCLLLWVLLITPKLSYAQDGQIGPEEAHKFINQSKTVCGLVVSTAYASNSKGSPTFLNLNKPYPNQIFTVVIWGTNRIKFTSPPEIFYKNKEICVSGEIELFRGVPEIIVESPSQITLPNDSSRNSPKDISNYHNRYSRDELIFIKALFAALKFDIDYTDSTWDKKTEDAVLQFQKQKNLITDGKIGPKTLRALAQAVFDIEILGFSEKTKYSGFLNNLASREELRNMIEKPKTYSRPTYYRYYSTLEVGDEVEFTDPETGETKLGQIEEFYDDEVEIYEYDEGETYSIDIHELE